MRLSKRIRLGSIRNEWGAAAVEFALLLPVLVLLLFGIIEFGRIYNVYLAVTHAAREGARIASVRNGTGATDDEIKAQVVARSAISITPSNVELSPLNFKSPGQPISVVVRYPVDLYIPFFGNYTIDLSSTGTMRIE